MEVLRARRLVVATSAYLLSTSLLLLLISSGPQLAEAQKLQQYCRFTPQHTLCKSTGIGKACGQRVPVRGVTEEAAAVIVAQHNQLRARVALGQETKGAPGPQPRAANMLQMGWDEELSLIAQRHADQCIFEHECADCRQVERFSVGQNLFISFQSDLDPAVHWSRAVQAWYDEVGIFSNNGVDSYNFDPSTGHYTAMMWADTSLVGCGFTMYEEGGWYKKLYTCNYGPTGNIIFLAMYRRGEPCASCPGGTSCSLSNPGLCVSNNNPKGIGKTTAVQSVRRRNQVGGQRRPNQGNQNRRGNTGRISSSPQPFQILQPFQLLPTLSRLQVPTTLPSHPATSGSRRILQNLQASGFNNRRSAAPVATPRVGNQQQASPSLAPTVVLEGATLQSEPPPNLPTIDNIQNFLMNFGKSSQVIRTNSLDSVKAIINSLPQDTQPLVFFRSSMGTIRQLSDMRLADGSAKAISSAPTSAASSGPRSVSPQSGANRRTVRSTVTPAMQVLDKAEQLEDLAMEENLENMLLSCQDVTAPCPVVALAGNWTHGRELQTNVVRSILSPSMGGQLVLGQTIPPPDAGAACVTLSHKFMAADTGDNLPQVQVSVWPLGQVLFQEDLSEVSSLQEDGWLKTNVNFAPIRNPFMVVLSVEPNPGPEEVEIALRGFMVTEGLC